jgi:hypothetical protein
VLEGGVAAWPFECETGEEKKLPDKFKNL